MKNLKKSLLVAVITLMSAVFCLTGCGDPYKNMTLSVDVSDYVSEGGYYEKVIELDDLGNDNSFSISATIDGVSSDVSTAVSFSASSPAAAFNTVPVISQNGNTTTATYDITSVGGGEIRIVSEEGNKTAIVKVSIKANINDYYFTHQYVSGEDEPDTTKEIVIESGSALTLNDDYITFVPQYTSYKNLQLLSITDVEMANGEKIQSYYSALNDADNYAGVIHLNQTFENNTLVVPNTDVRYLTATFKNEKLDKVISTRIKYVNVMDTSLIEVGTINASGVFEELERDENDTYVLTLAQNSGEAGTDFSKALYFYYNGTFAPYNYYLYVEDETGNLSNSYSSAYTETTVYSGDQLTDGRFVQVSQKAITGEDGDYLRLRFVNAELNKALSPLIIKVEVVIFPENIDVLDADGVEVGEDKPLEVYDLSAFEDGTEFSVNVLGLSDAVISRSPFTLKIVDEDGRENSNILVFARTRVLDSEDIVDSSRKPFYIKHTYGADQEILSNYYLVVTSTVNDISTSIPLKFIRGEMNVQLQYSEFAVKASDDATQTISVSGIMGITSMDISKIRISVDETLIEILGWNDEKTGVLFKVKGVLGSTTLTVTAPNGTYDTCRITVYEELMDTVMRVMGVEIKDVDSREEDEAIPELMVRTNSKAQMYFNVNGNGFATTVLSGMGLSITQSSYKCIERSATNELTINGNYGSTLITVTVYGFDETGVENNKRLVFTFNVTTVLPVEDLTFQKNYSIYSEKDIIQETDTIKERATLKFSTTPSDVKLTAKEVSFDVIIDGTPVLTGLNAESENTSLIDYSYQNENGIIHIILDPTNIKSAEVYASILNEQILRFEVRINITQSYLNQDGNMMNIVYRDSAYFEIKTVQKIETLQVTGLNRGQINFDVRNITENEEGVFVDGNVKVIQVSVGPSNAINKSLEAIGVNASGNQAPEDIINVSVTNTADDNYKTVTVTLYQNLNDYTGYFPEGYITVIIGTSDSKLDDINYGTYVSFRVYLDDGSYEHPFSISSASELDSIRNGLESYYALTNNINLTNYIANHATYSVSGWTPIGTRANPFVGGLMGSQTYYVGQNSVGEQIYQTNYYTISGLTISYLNQEDNDGYAGLFGVVTGTLHDISLTNVSISIDKDTAGQDYRLNNIYIGGVVAYLDADMENASVSDRNDETDITSISQDKLGISFQSTGSAYDSADGRIVRIGGVAGFITGAHTLSNSRANISIDARDNNTESIRTTVYIGGLVGEANGNIDNSQVDRTDFILDDVNVVVNANTTNIINTNSTIGGAVGFSKASVNGVYASSFIYGLNNIGGIVGRSENRVENCVANPHVYGRGDFVGGLIGYAVGATLIEDNTIDLTFDNYASVELNTHIRGNSYVGGLVGYLEVTRPMNVNTNGIYTYANQEDRVASNYVSDIYITGTSRATEDGDWITVYGGGLVGYADINANGSLNIDENFAYLNARLDDPQAFYGGLISTTTSTVLEINNVHTGGIVISASFSSEFSHIASFANEEHTVSNSYSTLRVVDGSENDVSIEAFASDADSDADLEGTNTYNFVLDSSTIDTFISALGSSVYDAGSNSLDTGLKEGDTSFGSAIWYRNNDAYEFTEGVGLPINIRQSNENGNAKLVLVVNIPPTGIVMDNGDCVVEGAYKTENEQKIVLSYSSIASNHYTSGRIDFPNMAATGDTVDGYRARLSDDIAEENTYLLSDIVELYALPRFIGTSRTKITSSNSAVLRVATQNVNGSNRLVLIANGVGKATLTATSSYDDEVTASIEINVVSNYNTFGSYFNEELSTSADSETLTITKGYSSAIYSSIIGQYTFTSNLYTATFDYAVSSGRGVRYIADFDYELEAQEFVDAVRFNGNTAVVENVNGKYVVTVDVDSTSVILEGIQAIDPVLVTMKPYIIVGDDKVILDQENTTYVEVINGTRKVSIYNNETEIEFEPNTDATFDVVIDTDNMNERLFFTFMDSYGDELIYYVEAGTTIVDNFGVDTGVVNLTCTERRTNEENGTITYKFTVKVDRNYLINDDGDTEYLNNVIRQTLAYRLHFFVIAPNLDFELRPTGATHETQTGELVFRTTIGGRENVSMNSAINSTVDYVSDVSISVLPQELSDNSMIVSNYPFDATSLGDGNYSFDVGSMSDIIMPSKISLLRIDVSPMYANYDSLTLTSTMGGDITLMQMVKNGDSYQRIGDSVNAITNGISLESISFVRTVNDLGSVYTENEFDGSIFVYALIPTRSTENSQITFTVNAYKDGAVVSTTSKTLTVVVAPYVDLQYRNQDDGVIASGTSTTFTATVLGFDGSLNFNETTLYVANGNVIMNAFSSPFVTLQSNGNGQYTIWISSSVAVGSTLSIHADISKLVYGKTLTAEDTLNFLVTEYVIDSVGVENVEEGNFVGRFNQPYTLRIVLNCTYNVYATGIVEKINALADSLSKSQVWNLVDGPVMSSLTERTYETFEITKDNDGYYQIRGIVLNSSEILRAGIVISYNSNNGSVSSTVDSELDNGYVYSLNSGNFGLAFYRYTDEDNPDPILNASQFLGMEAGVDYILMNDIVLSNWTPISTDINSIDGNGYVITIDSFNTADGDNANFGLFSTVQQGTILKNLIVEILPSNNVSTNERAVSTANISSETATLNFDKNFEFATSSSSMNFGIIAGTNLGIITNCEVTYNAYEYIAQREEILGNEHELSKNRTLYAGTEDETTLQIDRRNSTSIAVSAELNQASMGVLVGVNSGYITNSRVSNISMFGYGLVGGLVGTNNGKISSSYYYGGNIQNEATASDANAGTAGLVAVNSSTAFIEYSYVLGREIYPNATFGVNGSLTLGRSSEDITGLSSSDKTNFVGNNYSTLEDQTAQLYRAMNSAISSNTRSAGFVYQNQGTITNSYSNILVNGSSSAGFVFENSGTVSDVYSMSSIRQGNRAHSPFTGRDVSNNYSYLNTGSITYAHYLKISSGNIVEGINVVGTYAGDNLADEDAGESTEYADGINNEQFQNYSTFSGYAFNEDFNLNTFSSVSTAVWFIPNEQSYTDGGILSSTYQDKFIRSGYVFGRPELVSANLRTISVRVFAGVVTEENMDSILEFNYYYKSEPDGESANNPYLVSDAAKLDELILSISSAQNSSTITDAEDIKPITFYLRFITDIAYDEDILCNTYNVKFSGVIDGNGMDIGGLRITAKQDSDPNVDNFTTIGNENLGLFGEIVAIEDASGNTIRGVVKNLNIDVNSIYGSGVNYVGALAGKIIDSSVYNVNVTSSNNTIIEGGKIVGGVFGLIEGESEIVNVSASVSVTAYNKSNNNGYSSLNPYGNILKYNTYQDQLYNSGSERITQNVSYVGGVAGVVDVSARGNSNISYEGGDTRNSRVRKISVSGEIVQENRSVVISLSGENVGGVFGYVGSTSNVSDLSFIVNRNTKIYASRSAGGVIAENHGIVERSYAEYVIADQTVIDNYYGENYAYSSSTYAELFGDLSVNAISNRNAHYIGGLVGVNIGGTIHNCYSKLQVYSHDSIIAGGLVGLALTGKISQSYASGSVGSNAYIGGLLGMSVTARMANDTTSQNYIYFNINENLIKTPEDASTPYTINGFSNLTIEKVVAGNAWSSADVELSKKGSISFGTLIGAIIYDKAIVQEGDSAISIVQNEKKFAVVSESSESTRMKNEVNYSVTVTTKVGSATISQPQVGNITEVQRTGGYVSYFQSSSSFQYYLYNALGSYGSQRTLRDIVAREFIYDTIAYDIWNQYTWTSDEEWFPTATTSVANLSATAKKFYTDFGYSESSATADKIRNINIGIYDVNVVLVTSVIYKGWTQIYWKGTNVDDVGLDLLYLPILKQENYKDTIEVYTEDDLRLMQENLTSNFVLMNDIELTGEWSPVGTEEAPFMGSLYSNPSAGVNYAIKQLQITTSAKNMGLFGVVSSANLHDFNVELAKIDTVSAQNVSVVCAKAVKGSKGATVMTDIGVTNIAGNVASVRAEEVATFGAVLGYGEFVVIENCSVYRNMATDGSLGSFDINIASVQVTTTGGEYVNLSSVKTENPNVSTVGIGGVVGYISNFSEKANDSCAASYLSHLSAENITLNVNIQRNTDSQTSTVSVGGVVGDSTGMVMQSSSNATYKNEYTITRPLGGIFASYVGLDNPEWNASGESSHYSLNSSAVTIKVTADQSFSKAVQIGGAIGNYSTLMNENLVINDDSIYNQNLEYVKVRDLNMTYTVVGYTSGGVKAKIGGVAGSLASEIDVQNIYLNGTNTITYVYQNTAVNAGGEMKIGGVAGLLSLTTTNDTATISDVLIDDITIKDGGASITDSTKTYIGGLAGELSNGDIDNIIISKYNITSNKNKPTTIGGLVGYMRPNTSLKNASVSGVIRAGENATDVGGLVGYNNGGAIDNVYSSTSITNGNNNDSASNVGGLVGNNTGTISYAVSSGSVIDARTSNTTTNMGGLVGSSGGEITHSVSYVNITITKSCTDNNVGGLVGSLDSGTISNSYSTGYITMQRDGKYGGLVGYMKNATIKNAYTLSRFVVGSDRTKYQSTTKGGLVSVRTGSTTIQDSYFYLELTPYSSYSSFGVSFEEGNFTRLDIQNDSNWTISDTAFPKLSFMQSEGKFAEVDSKSILYSAVNILDDEAYKIIPTGGEVSENIDKIYITLNSSLGADISISDTGFLYGLSSSTSGNTIITNNGVMFGGAYDTNNQNINITISDTFVGINNGVIDNFIFELGGSVWGDDNSPIATNNGFINRVSVEKASDSYYFVWNNNNGEFNNCSFITFGQNVEHCSVSHEVVPSSALENVISFGKENIRINNIEILRAHSFYIPYYITTGKLNIGDLNNVWTIISTTRSDRNTMLQSTANWHKGVGHDDINNGLIMLTWTLRYNWYESTINSKFFWSDSRASYNSTTANVTNGSELFGALTSNTVTTINLTNDIELAYKMWNTGEFTVSSKEIKGSHVIRNMSAVNQSMSSYSGFIGIGSSNISVTSIGFEGGYSAGACAGAVVGRITSNTFKIDQVYVDNMELYSNISNSVGSVAGYLNRGTLSINNTYVTSFVDVRFNGKLIGKLVGNRNTGSLTISNTYVQINLEKYYDNASSVSNAYYISDTSDPYLAIGYSGSKGITESELQTYSLGFDWSIWTRDNSQSINSGYPFLRWQGDIGYWKDYTMSAPGQASDGAYYVDSLSELVWAFYGSTDLSNATVRLAGDFDLSGRYWTPVTKNVGKVDFYSGAIKNMFICEANSASNIGFFATIGEGQTIYCSNTQRSTGATFIDAIVYAPSSSSVGIICGTNNGDILGANIYSKDNTYNYVIGGSSVGGAIGYNGSTGNAQQIQINSSVVVANNIASSTDTSVGGAIGRNNGDAQGLYINNSTGSRGMYIYGRGSNYNVGGAVSYNAGRLYEVYVGNSSVFTNIGTTSNNSAGTLIGRFNSNAILRNGLSKNYNLYRLTGSEYNSYGDIANNSIQSLVLDKVGLIVGDSESAKSSTWWSSSINPTYAYEYDTGNFPGFVYSRNTNYMDTEYVINGSSDTNSYARRVNLRYGETKAEVDDSFVGYSVRFDTSSSDPLPLLIAGTNPGYPVQGRITGEINIACNQYVDDVTALFSYVNNATIADLDIYLVKYDNYTTIEVQGSVALFAHELANSTVSNLYIDGELNSIDAHGGSGASFAVNSYSVELSNIKVSNIQISSAGTVGGLIANGDGITLRNKINIDNVNIRVYQLAMTQYVGMAFGNLYSSSSIITTDGSSVEYCNIIIDPNSQTNRSYWTYAGGFAGRMDVGAASQANMYLSLKDIEISRVYTSSGSSCVGGFAGSLDLDTDDSINIGSTSNIVISGAEYAGGFAGIMDESTYSNITGQISNVSVLVGAYDYSYRDPLGDIQAGVTTTGRSTTNINVVGTVKTITFRLPDTDMAYSKYLMYSTRDTMTQLPDVCPNYSFWGTEGVLTRWYTSSSITSLENNRVNLVAVSDPVTLYVTSSVNKRDNTFGQFTEYDYFKISAEYDSYINMYAMYTSSIKYYWETSVLMNSGNSAEEYCEVVSGSSTLRERLPGAIYMAYHPSSDAAKSGKWVLCALDTRQIHIWARYSMDIFIMNDSDARSFMRYYKKDAFTSYPSELSSVFGEKATIYLYESIWDEPAYWGNGVDYERFEIPSIVGAKIDLKSLMTTGSAEWVDAWYYDDEGITQECDRTEDVSISGKFTGTKYVGFQAKQNSYTYYFMSYNDIIKQSSFYINIWSSGMNIYMLNETEYTTYTTRRSDYIGITADQYLSGNF